MPVNFDIINPLNLIYIRHWGFATLAESMESAAACARHPDFRPSSPHLADMSGITGYEADYIRLFEFQAQLADHFLPKAGEQLVVIVAPPGPPLEVANMVRRSWCDQTRLMLRVVTTMDEALDILAIRPAAWARHAPGDATADKSLRD